MPSVVQSAFIGGEWAPEYDGRSDLPLYRQGLSRGRNMVLQGTAGGMTMRPGFRHVAAARDGADYKVRLRRFSPQGNLQYLLEFGAGYIRFYRNKAQVTSGGSPFEVATSYAAGDLAGLDFTAYQQNLYIWHQSHQTQVLTWNGGDLAWSIVNYNPYDGPYLDAIGQVTTATPDGATDLATIALNNTTEVNGGQGFLASDVARLVRFEVPVWSLVNQVIDQAGAEYNVGDIVIPAGGTPLAPSSGQDTAAVTITQIGTGGKPEGFAITDPGQYLIAPPGTFSQGYTNGIGSGITGGSLTWSQNQPDSGPPNPTVWLPGTIAAVTDTTHAVVQLGLMQVDAQGTTQQAYFPSTAAITSWRLGAWSATTGFPGAGAVFQSRLLASGYAPKPKRVFGSTSGGITTQAGAAPTGFASMSPSLATNEVVDDNAIEFDLDDDIGGAVEWLSGAGSAQIPQLAIGSGDAEFILQGANAGALTPSSVQVYRETRYGAAPVSPLRIGRALIFAERGGKKLRQWQYQYLAGGYIGPDAAPQSHHLYLDGIARLDYAQVPYQVIWGATTGGSLFSIGFQLDEKEAADNIAAANSHQLGGSWFGAAPQVADLCVVPSEDGSYDQVWLAVLRNDTGTTQQTIEVMDPYFRDRPLDQACFLDSAVSSALNQPNTTCTLSAGPYDSGQTLPQRGDGLAASFGAALASSGDLVPGTVLRVANGTFLVTQFLSATLVDIRCIDSPQNLLTAAAGTWSYTRMTTSVSGFNALAGATVGVIADGSYVGTQSVPGDGVITLASAASYVTAGRPYVGALDTLDLDLPEPDGSAGTSQMKLGRLDHLYLRLFQSLGCEYGIVKDDGTLALDPLDPLDSDDITDWAPPVFTGDLRLPLPGGSTMRRRVAVRQTLPWPLTVSAIVAKGGVGSGEVSPR